MGSVGRGGGLKIIERIRYKYCKHVYYIFFPYHDNIMHIYNIYDCCNINFVCCYKSLIVVVFCRIVLCFIELSLPANVIVFCTSVTVIYRNDFLFPSNDVVWLFPVIDSAYMLLMMLRVLIFCICVLLNCKILYFCILHICMILSWYGKNIVFCSLEGHKCRI